jgi:hypothetical protein
MINLFHYHSYHWAPGSARLENFHLEIFEMLQTHLETFRYTTICLDFNSFKDDKLILSQYGVDISTLVHLNIAFNETKIIKILSRTS